MIKKLRILIKDLRIIKEGNSFKDKFAIFWYFFMLPLNYLHILIGQKLSKSLIFNVVLKNKDGMFFCENDIGLICTASSSYERILREYFNLNKGVFVDIGANIGKYTIKVARRIGKQGKVLAIEPEKKNFELLLQNIKLNNLKNVIPLKLACLDKNTKSKLYLKKRDRGGYSIKKQFSGKYEEVNGRKLDTLLDNLKIKKVDLIKIDAEDAEPDILKGATKTLSKNHPKIIFESRNDKEHLEKVKRILNEFNYKIKRIDSRNYFAY